MRVQRTFLARACAAQPRTAVRTSALAASSSARMSTTIAAVEQGDSEKNPLLSELNRLRKPVELSEKYIDMSGAVIFREMMKEHGVEKVFGYPVTAPARPHQLAPTLPVVPSNRSLAPLSVPVYVYHAAILHRVQLIRLAAG